jgi:hypothetical protein
MPERCIDANIAIKWCIKGEAFRRKARKFLHDSQAADIQLIAPPLFEMEPDGYLPEGVYVCSEAEVTFRTVMITNTDQYQKAQEELRQLEERLSRLQQSHPFGAKGFTKAGIRKMIARLHEEIALYEGSQEVRRANPL